SCSNYAKQNIENKGFIPGLISFVDRHFYREHSAASTYYSWIIGSEGEMRLDDDFYLNSPSLALIPDVQAGSYNSAGNEPLQDNVKSTNNWYPEKEYADSLFIEGDYQEAKVCYKRLHFYATDQYQKNIYAYQTARSALGAGQYQEAQAWIDIYLSDKSLTEYMLNRGLFFQGLIHVSQGQYSAGMMEMESSCVGDSTQDLVIKAWVQAEHHNWSSAASLLESVKSPHAGIILPQRKKWIENLRNEAKLPWKNTALSLTMSSIIPGSGQLYCGHTWDGVQAFAYNAALVYATWMAYRYEQSNNKPRIGTSIGIGFSCLFYAGNLRGAWRTAQYRNHRISEDLIKPIRKGIFSWEYSQSPPKYEENY
ncbi:MAG: hypothetical protein PHO32_06260, partial [Candidatus Cloacimonetes bacterium]|nr:hypothetical protein [Candidatus Cloacimonadota bacterium]